MTWYKKITVEVPFLLFSFCFSLTGPINTNLIIFRTCYVVLGYNKTGCALLGNSTDNATQHLEKLVEPEVNIINMVGGTIGGVCSIVICTFAGPWSDRFGRKPVLVMCQIGSALSLLLLTVFSYFQNISSWYSILCGVPSMLTGGFPTYMLIVFSYITDITNEENRAIRMVILNVISVIGGLIGGTSSSYLLYATNYVTVFALGTTCVIIGVLYTIFLVPESVQNIETEGKINGIFQISNITEMVKTTLKKRANYNRMLILLIILLLTVTVFISGEGGLTFLFLREKFSWTLKKYTLVNCVFSVIGAVGTLFETYVLNNLLKITESVLILLGYSSMLSGSLLLGFATSDTYIYAANGVKSLGGVIQPMISTLITKLVPADEIGKIFSMIMLCQFLVGLGSTPMYTAIYNSTIDTNSAIFYFVSAGLCCLDITIIIIIIIVQNISPPIYNALNNDAEVLVENEPGIN